MTIYFVKPTQESLHGTFSCEHQPVVTIASGDTVRLQTLEVGWRAEKRKAAGVPQTTSPYLNRERGDRHALCGPIEVVDAKAGMVLEIQINKLVPAEWALTSAGGRTSAVNQFLEVVEADTLLMDWNVNTTTMTAVNQFGDEIAIRPFMGLMGMPPSAKGIHSTNPPRFCGGNIDCKELVPGSSLFLPIPVDGAYFSVGDGHAAQGDGEVAGVALECPMEQVDLTFYLHQEMSLTMPRAKTPAGWITFGFDEDLNQATMIALKEMVELMKDLYGINSRHALALASAAVDLRITQIVNGVQGVHAILPYGAIKRASNLSNFYE